MDPLADGVASDGTCFVDGPFGAGKSRILGRRLRQLLEAGVPGYAILVLVPDRTAQAYYDRLVADLSLGPCGSVDIFTYYGLANRLVGLFWPLVAADAGFSRPEKPPVPLNYEAAQYLMGRLVAPLLDQGYFEGLAMRPQRILSQLLDNLNKAAVNGFDLNQVGDRLKEAWTGEENRLLYYDQVQECIELFRAHCLASGVLDFSLVIEVFQRHLVAKPEFWRYFTERFRHLLVDRLEESTPVAQDLVQRLLASCQSGLVTCDPGAGFRVFLGVDSVGAVALAKSCHSRQTLPPPAAFNADLAAFRARLGQRLGQVVTLPQQGRAGGAVAALVQTRYRAQMLVKVATEIVALHEKGVPPGQIAVVAPYADGVMRFVLGEALREGGVPYAVLRRFESLREEPIVRACLTLAALAHRHWGRRPLRADVAEALGLALPPLDPVRAALLARLLYDPRQGVLGPQDTLSPVELERIGFAIMERYDGLRQWLDDYRGHVAAPFDHFLRRLFGEVLAGPELNPEDAAVYSKLIASAAAFVRTAPALGLEGAEPGQRYVEMVMEGTVAAQHLSATDIEVAAESLVAIAPVYTYLLSQHTARYQFWLDIGALAWWQPPHQPLTNHHVLARRWTRGQPWSEAVDFAERNRILYRLVGGLVQRCSGKIYLCTSELETTGEILDAPLIRAVQQVLQEDP